MTALSIIAFVAAASWALRIALVVIFPAQRLPQTLRDALEHLAPAVLAAIVGLALVDLLSREAGVRGRLPTLGALALVALAAWRTRSFALTAVLALVAVALLDIVG